jgi:hypothetical protein
VVSIWADSPKFEHSLGHGDCYRRSTSHSAPSFNSAKGRLFGIGEVIAPGEHQLRYPLRRIALGGARHCLGAVASEIDDGIDDERSRPLAPNRTSQPLHTGVGRSTGVLSASIPARSSRSPLEREHVAAAVDDAE